MHPWPSAFISVALCRILSLNIFFFFPSSRRGPPPICIWLVLKSPTFQLLKQLGHIFSCNEIGCKYKNNCNLKLLLGWTEIMTVERLAWWLAHCEPSVIVSCLILHKSERMTKVITACDSYQRRSQDVGQCQIDWSSKSAVGVRANRQGPLKWSSLWCEN